MLSADLSSRNASDYELDRTPVEITAASFTSFNSEEGFGSPAARRNKDRPNVFDMDDNDLQVTCVPPASFDQFDKLHDVSIHVHTNAAKMHCKSLLQNRVILLSDTGWFLATGHTVHTCIIAYRCFFAHRCMIVHRCSIVLMRATAHRCIAVLRGITLLRCMAVV